MINKDILQKEKYYNDYEKYINKVNMKKILYHIETIKNCPSYELEEKLNYFGEQGWNLIYIDGEKYFFKQTLKKEIL